MRRTALLLAVAAIAEFLTGNGCLAQTAQSILFSEDFTGYPQNACWTDGSTFGPWTVAWSGYGCVGVATDSTGTWLNETPANNTGQARSALTIGPNPWSQWPGINSFTYRVNLKTVSQLCLGLFKSECLLYDSPQDDRLGTR
jgi:hypothetical protein